jgi:ABC-type proline/glycine betaine transport system permease subunit
MPAPVLPRFVLLLAAFYFAASLAHFGHNAEYIAFYPGMPSWLTRETVYFAWLGVTSLGVVAFLFARIALPAPALLFLAAYGAFGLDGLAHYTLALCSEHTFVANITIWSEAITGLALLLVSTVLLARRLMPVAEPTTIRIARESNR